ncbi:glycosyltransferase [Vibrio hyugaensis]|uniref:glycosyltransferase n=1 Tax=Vibrio hyugaensis TaxID=1534743 RepID=UPI0005EF527F|nr:glycosyltransferase [Vibrio hyugaensis]
MTNVIIDRRDKNQPVLSIVIVTFNAGKTLRKTLDSILDLNLESIEVVVIDGDSSDDTLKILEEYKVLINYAVSEIDQGIYDAMNKGVGLSKGRYVYFLGADDLLLTDFSKLVNLAKSSRKILYSNVKLLTDNSIYLGRFNKYKIMQSNICHQAIFYPRVIFDDLQYKLKYKLLSDYWLNIYLFGKFEWEYHELTICLYNDQGASSSGDLDFENDKVSLIRREFGLFFYTIKLMRNFLVSCLKG